MPAESWDRIEPSCSSEELEPGLRAELADPLWMLGRQWQLGEWTGDDAGSPVRVRLRTRTHRLRSYHTEGLDAPVALRPDVPLEGLVESEPLTESPGLRAEVGLELLRALQEAGLTVSAEALRGAFPLRVDPDELEILPPRIRRRLGLLARRACDGLDLLRTAPDQVAARLSLRPADRNKVAAVLRAVGAGYAALICTPPEGVSSWRKERLEHSFSLRAAVGGKEAELRAQEYAGGRLDWYDFDLAEGVGPAEKADSGERREIVTLPGPIRVSGAPAQRWWELEEGQVRFGEMDSGPADAIRMVVAEFWTVCSDDWHLIPIRLPAASLTRVEGLDVLDTFGRNLSIDSTALQDVRRRGAGRVWRFFELSGDDSVERNLNPWLLLLPAAPGSQHSEPLERVIFLRDEGANLAWAIEETLEAPNGRPFRRPRTAPDRARLAAADPEQAWSYELFSQVPSNWIPFIPELIGNGPEMRLRRARMEAWTDLDRRLAGPRGRLLAPDEPLRLYEEEIPRGGLEVTRAWQWTRSANGGAHLWSARRKRPGHGEKGSGLQADRIVAEPEEE